MLQETGYQTFNSDLDPSEFDRGLGDCEALNFLSGDVPSFFLDTEIDMIVTNPPFGDDAEKVIRHALSFENIRAFAFLLRSEWNHASTRRDLFTSQPFAYEIVLTWRPRWDWWLTPDQRRAQKIAAGKDGDAPDASPRHNFSWFVWDRLWRDRPTTIWATREDDNAKGIIEHDAASKPRRRSGKARNRGASKGT